jgi:hypothetical protein
VRGNIRILTLGALALAAACGEGTSPADVTDVTMDQSMAVFATDAAGQDIELMRGPGGRFGMGLPALPGRFECGDAAPRGLTVTRTCTFYDADGVEQSAYDGETTEKVVMHAEMSGTIDRGDWSATVSRIRDFTVTGLAGAETSMTWNGTGSSTMSKVRQTDGGEVQMDMTSEETVTDVVIPVPRAEDGWPLGGTITSSMTMTITGGEHDGEVRERVVTITFDGTQYATVTVNGETFTVDLANRCHAGRHRWGQGDRGGYGRHGGDRE